MKFFNCTNLSCITFDNYFTKKYIFKNKYDKVYLHYSFRFNSTISMFIILSVHEPQINFLQQEQSS